MEDKKDWVRLNKQFIEYEYKDENVWNSPLKFGNLEEDFELILNDTSTILFAIIEEEKMIGFMNIQCFYSIWSHGKVFFLDDFFIEENFRRKGYGEKALKDLQKYAKKSGIKRIQLMAENTNPRAIKFYKKHKFNEQEIHLFLKYLI
ncbi:N-acetyltransferase [Fusobacterium nucleatum subsp. nucleatum ATCC 25586]|uniref:Diamine acetyltransferase n=1 Tax=Fusobacterium nucleatum subsp. nucleatum (strain ATCC 25586 / DSM 15643 / BCRC 10681 / CIP 101130 / JCM 8532 / KCTC 2640 / LMG 13131 / VPI 4355) TaxID=190304 RepID=Q8REP1_FUSNN|nr:Diamine acetyltransferase [Fusobacterium nucleatum subsp. nucleatum ATCC 25586]AVQ15989.1 N-acetyltransferase [Fusobacterium nucleatum subsp. nucleatum ATCC 25586]